LIDAFSSTLEESIESDLLLHVVDASDPKIEDRISITDDVLGKIGANQKKIYVFNQIDKISEEYLLELLDRYKHLNPICISAYAGMGIVELKKEVLSHV